MANMKNDHMDALWTLLSLGLMGAMLGSDGDKMKHSFIQTAEKEAKDRLQSLNPQQLENMEELVNKILLHNSTDKNIICCVEEMSELTKVLTKKLRHSPKYSTDNLLEEVSHVLLMCNVLVKSVGFTQEQIHKIQIDAVKRMEEN